MQGEISFFLHTGRVVLCALVELLRYLKIQPKSIRGLHEGMQTGVVLAACVDS